MRRCDACFVDETGGIVPFLNVVDNSDSQHGAKRRIKSFYSLGVGPAYFFRRENNVPGLVHAGKQKTKSLVSNAAQAILLSADILQ
jgi:hypothetical protein